jgi:hypothetical protein
MEPTKAKSKVAEPDPLDPALVLTHADLDCLNRSLKKRIATTDELLAAVSATTTLTVEGIPVTLEPRLLMRLKSRCLDKPNFPRWLSEVVKRQLHDYAGW